MPLPAVRDDDPDEPDSANALVRTLETCAGLLAGGLLVIGAILVVLQVVLPSDHVGGQPSTLAGPTWWRALTQLGAGIFGEVLYRTRFRWSSSTRGIPAAVVVIVSVFVLYLCWWS